MVSPPARRLALAALLSACADAPPPAPAPAPAPPAPPRLLLEAKAPGNTHVARAYLAKAAGPGGYEELRLFVSRAADRPPDPAADRPALAARYGGEAGAPALRWTSTSALHVRLRPDAAVLRRLDRHDGVRLSYSAFPPPLAIEDVTVIDTAGGPPRPHSTVLVEDGRVVAVGPASRLRAPPGVRRVVGAGGFVVPGLWDMHAHLSLTSEASLPVYLANGVTGVRDM
ncbi:MAG TPA: hypothetical protein VFS00_00720, partial [Polyangiaceae bacterium]|nr:hypothetical protein [Polyangiaceae bacterium]